MLASTLLISPAPNPVKVRLCFGREKPGPTGPCISEEMGAPIEGFRSRGGFWVAVVAILQEMCREGRDALLKDW
jgi:hypothetical protein